MRADPFAEVLPADELPALVADMRAAGERVVLTNGCFDVVHAGHVQCLAQARDLGDRLIVGLNSDESVRALKGPGRPVNPAGDRARVLAALSSVDYVSVFGELTPQRLIRLVRPDVYVKGGDYGKGVPERDLVAALGGRVEVLDLVPGRSTTGLLERVRASGG
ncbi:MAG TPA: D-glycero-beta-D-manno-heptose 1-phosphate adenylyltransferase [Micromonosporaceae bacterium]